jgi:phospholipase A1/A2
MTGHRRTYKHLRIATAFLPLLIGCSAFAMEHPLQLQDCAAIPDDHDRLACFDSLAANAASAASTRENLESAPIQRAPASTVGTSPVAEEKESDSFLADHWELVPEKKRGVFKFRPHNNNYLIATYNTSPNNTPYLPFRSLTPNSGDLSRNELAFQIGFKLKLLENVANTPLDLWFGYTQQSFWQASNHDASSPFRETDYQPEVMAITPLNFRLLGLRARFAGVGFVHQSNGQASTLSRSWNRVYAQAGFERGDFSLTARVWQRINEPRATDDNADIVDYMGRGDLEGIYRKNGHEFSILARHNFSTDKGAVQLGWAFPLQSNLKGYLRLFSGYGYSLIDYNAYQRVIGLGVQINFH